MDIIIAIDDCLPLIISTILSETQGIEGVRGYKIGAAPAIYNSLPYVASLIREHSPNAQIIFDHQKAGNDLVAMTFPFLSSIYLSNIRDVIIFPFTGEQIAMEWVSAVKKLSLNPIFGCYLTDPGFEAIVNTNLLFHMFNKARLQGVTQFVVPATKERFTQNLLESFRVYSTYLSEPFTYYIPGIGAQGGSLDFVRKMHNLYGNIIPIVGRLITQSDDIREATYKLIESLSTKV